MSSDVRKVIREVIGVIKIVALVAFIIWKIEYVMICLSVVLGLFFVGFGLMFLFRAVTPDIAEIIGNLLWGILLISSGIAMPLHFFGGDLGLISDKIIFYLREFEELKITMVQIGLEFLLFWLPIIAYIYGFIEKLWEKITGKKNPD